MSIDVFKKYYKEEKDNLDKRINEYNEELIKEDNLLLKENSEYFKELNTNGKLVRGLLVDLGYNLLKEDKEYSYNLSLAYEIFQTAILVHDDIIDNDNKRRGKDTIHYINYNKYRKYSDNDLEVKHLGDSIGICMGDYGLYQANKMISSSYQDDKNLGRVLNYFNDTVLNTIRGELLDVILPFQSKNVGLDNKLLEESIMNIYRLKTAHYTIIGPMSTGLLLAGATQDMLDDIKEFGERVGIAFQIQDDILGIYSEEMGKVKASDIKEFKQTILYSHIMTTEYKDELLKYYGSDNLTDEIIEEVRNLFKKSNSLDYATNMMNKLYDESLEILDIINWISEDKKEILKGFVEYLKIRNK